MRKLYKKITRETALVLAFLVGPMFLLNTTVSAEEGSNDISVYLVIHFKAHPDRLREFKGIMAGVEEAMTSEPGFQSAKVYRGVETEGEFILVERWQSMALHQEHYNRIVASGDWAHILTLLTEDPAMTYTRPFS